MTRRMPYRCVERLWRLTSAVRIRSAILERVWRLSLLVMVMVGLATLPACRAQAIHPKVRPYATAVDAEKIDTNLLRLVTHVRRDGKPLDVAAAEMGMATVSGRLRLDLLTQPLDDSTIQKIQLPGVAVHHVSRRYQRVSVSIVNLTLLNDLAQIPEVRMILPDYGATTFHETGAHSLQPGDTSHVR